MSIQEKSLEYNIEAPQRHIIEELLDKNASTSIASKISGVPEETIKKYAENQDLKPGQKDFENIETLYESIGIENADLYPSQVGELLNQYIEQEKSFQDVDAHFKNKEKTDIQSAEIAEKLLYQDLEDYVTVFQTNGLTNSENIAQAIHEYGRINPEPGEVEEIVQQQEQTPSLIDTSSETDRLNQRWEVLVHQHPDINETIHTTLFDDEEQDSPSEITDFLESEETADNTL